MKAIDRELQIFNFFIERVMEKIRATNEAPVPQGRSALRAALQASLEIVPRQRKPNFRYCEYPECGASTELIWLTLNYIPLRWRSGQGDSAPRLRSRTTSQRGAMRIETPTTRDPRSRDPRKRDINVDRKSENRTNAEVETAGGSMIDLKNARAAFDVFESCA
jgi:hypothetical protein